MVEVARKAQQWGAASLVEKSKLFESREWRRLYLHLLSPFGDEIYQLYSTLSRPIRKETINIMAHAERGRLLDHAGSLQDINEIMECLTAEQAASALMESSVDFENVFSSHLDNFLRDNIVTMITRMQTEIWKREENLRGSGCSTLTIWFRATTEFNSILPESAQYCSKEGCESSYKTGDRIGFMLCDTHTFHWSCCATYDGYSCPCLHKNIALC